MQRNFRFALSFVTAVIVTVTGGMSAAAEMTQARPRSQRPSLGPGESNWVPPAGPRGGFSTGNLTDVTPAELVEVLLGDEGDLAISGVTYSGALIAAGLFEDDEGVLDPDEGIFDQGVILSTGDIESVEGPNSLDMVTTVHGLAGDAGLDALVTFPTLDASVLEFDLECVAAGTIDLMLVFSSDEYNESVGGLGLYEDVFALFLDGTNVALLPDGADVTIDTVNCGNPYDELPGGPGAQNCDLFRNNDCDDSSCEINTEMDGLTVVLSISAPLSAGPHHFKLAIADSTDSTVDSNVFIGGVVTGCPADTSVCGDGIVEGDEECDDGGTVDGDGCSSTCVCECGDGDLDPGEECDDGNRDPYDGCSPVCLFEEFALLRHPVLQSGAILTSAGGFVLTGSAGQHDAGLLGGIDAQMTGGFWYAVLPGVCDADGTITFFDIEHLTRCLMGPAGPLLPDCDTFDVNGDGRVDLLDVADVLLLETD